jgi:hypothetical protein
VTDRVAVLGEFDGEMALALADPQQRRSRVAAQRRLDQREQGAQQPRILLRRGLAAAAGAARHLEWHMRQALTPILFDEHGRAAAEAQRRSPVSKARVEERVPGRR